MNTGPEENLLSFSDQHDTEATAAFEAELRGALRPLALPPGFAERVLATSAAQTGAAQPVRRAKVLPFRNWRVALGSAIAACLVAGSFATQEIHHRHEREHERAVANQQFETATRITDQALAHTREQLERAGVFRQQ